MTYLLKLKKSTATFNNFFLELGDNSSNWACDLLINDEFSDSITNGFKYINTHLTKTTFAKDPLISYQLNLTFEYEFQLQKKIEGKVKYLHFSSKTKEVLKVVPKGNSNWETYYFFSDNSKKGRYHTYTFLRYLTDYLLSTVANLIAKTATENGIELLQKDFKSIVNRKMFKTAFQQSHHIIDINYKDN